MSIIHCSRHTDIPCLVRKVTKAGKNQGRYFFACPSVGCDFFSFAKSNADVDRTKEAREKKTQISSYFNPRVLASTSTTSRGSATQTIFARSSTKLSNSQDGGTAHAGFSQIQPKKATKPKLMIVGSNGGQTIKLSLEPIRGGVFYVSSCNQTEVHALLRSIDGGAYDSATQRWTFPWRQYKAVASALKTSTTVNVMLDEPPVYVRKALDTPLAARAGKLSDDEVLHYLSEVPADIGTKLMPFQRYGVAFGLHVNGRVLIADEMGLGKTVQSIALVCSERMRKHWPFLVVVPSSLRYTWVQEITRWASEHLRFDQIQVIKTGRDEVWGGAKAVIVSYDLVAKMEAKLASKHFNVVICDEAHYLKNKSAKRTKAMMGLLRSAAFVVLLTGTPLMSRPAELYTQVSAIRPNLLPSQKQFETRYCKGRQTHFGWKATGAEHLDELNALLAVCMVRRLKRDVLTDLPPKQRQTIELSLKSSEALTRLQAIMKRLKAVSNDKMFSAMQARDDAHGYGDDGEFGGDDTEAAMVRTTITESYRLTGEAKTSAIVDYVSNLLEQDCKFLLFAHHRSVLDALEACLVKAKTKFIRIDGGTSASKRPALVEQFQSDEQVRVALLGITAAGVGLTLHAASTVVFAELYWTPAALLQAEDRVHRIGQRYNCHCIYLIGGKTLDSRLWPLLNQKMSTSSTVLDGTTSCLETHTIPEMFSVQGGAQAEKKKHRDVGTGANVNVSTSTSTSTIVQTRVSAAVSSSTTLTSARMSTTSSKRSGDILSMFSRMKSKQETGGNEEKRVSKRSEWEATANASSVAPSALQPSERTERTSDGTKKTRSLCPVCGKFVALEAINTHLDSCLAEGPTRSPSRTVVSQSTVDLFDADSKRSAAFSLERERRPCPEGSVCTRRNPIHLAAFTHPEHTSANTQYSDVSGSSVSKNVPLYY